MLTESTGLFSNWWWAVIASDYSVSMLLAVSFIAMVLKVIATLKPGTKDVTELIAGWFWGIPGARRVTDTKETTTTVTRTESGTEEKK